MTPVRIPRAKLDDVRRKLHAEQAGKKPEERVRYSYYHRTFWRWAKQGLKWRKRECSRNGKGLGEFIGPAYDEVRFQMRLNRHLHSEGGLVGISPLDVPSFIGGKAGYKPVFARSPRQWSDHWVLDGTADAPAMRYAPGMQYVHTETGRWSAKQPETTMTLLKLSILLWRAAHPAANYCHPDGVIPQGNVRTAIGELSQDGFVTLHATGYRLTDKANVFVEHLTKQPLPVPTAPQWQMPATGGVVKPF